MTVDSTTTSQLIRISLGYTIKQVLFHAHFEDNKHHQMSDWEITLIDQTDSADNLRRKGSFWQYEFDTVQPNEPNASNMAFFSRFHLLSL